ncbi:hypothetical protein ACQ4LE_003080 [Meloidogyne hapla]
MKNIVLFLFLIFFFANVSAHFIEDEFESDKINEFEAVDFFRGKRACTSYMRRRCCNSRCAGDYCFGFMCVLCC